MKFDILVVGTVFIFTHFVVLLIFSVHTRQHLLLIIWIKYHALYIFILIKTVNDVQSVFDIKLMQYCGRATLDSNMQE